MALTAPFQVRRVGGAHRVGVPLAGGAPLFAAVPLLQPPPAATPGYTPEQVEFLRRKQQESSRSSSPAPARGNYF